ncbi:ABC transporter permease [Paractinoplanes lichenicola]|uniref:Transport permease protein n=1 Tax=Paractinoplanes lichenicola TaxID=2802976 RepID=A0ABS1W0D4_9ACTN|nr:ABC transporter permease [Actinoplanes lichenicola]MBL7260157.1 ABC transporter permease [Actinoplanes lichenicola]
MAVTTLIADSAVVAKRNLIKIKRVPALIVFTTLSPMMFVVLFAYVFGGAIDPATGGAAYREFLIPGIFTQTIIFGTITTGAGLAEDVTKGIVDRFRSLPMAPSAVLAGRTLSDVVNNAIALAVMAVTGLIVGWRVRGSFLDALWAFTLLLIFAYAASWVMALLGLLIPSPEVIGSAPYLGIFPLTSFANTFVPPATMPTPLRVFAEWNPISAVTQAARDLFGNADPDPTVPVSTAWPLEHPQLYTLLWAVAIVAVFAPLASRQYRRAATR